MLVGLIRANPIIVSIAANILIYGIAALTSNQTAYGPSDLGELFLRQVIAGVPVEFIVFLALIALGQFILTYTVFGRNLLLVGSGSAAADALGLAVAPHDISRLRVGRSVHRDWRHPAGGSLQQSRQHESRRQL